MKASELGFNMASNTLRRLGALIATVVIAASLSVMGAPPASAVTGWTSALTPVPPQPVPAGNALSYSYQIQCSNPLGCGTLSAHIPPPPGWSAGAGAPTVNIPSGLAGIVSYTANADGSLDVLWTNAVPGQSNSVQLNWPTLNMLTAPGDQPLAATVTDADQDTQTVTATDGITATPNPVIIKTGPDSVSRNTDFSYFITATNESPGPTQFTGGLALTDTVITDPIPAGLIYVDCDPGTAYPGASCEYDNGVVTFTIPGNFGGPAVQFAGSVTVRIPAGTPVGTEFDNVATITGTPVGSNDPISRDDNAITTTSGNGTGTAAEQFKTGLTEVIPGQGWEYDLRLRNSGTTGGTGVIHDDAIPTNIMEVNNISVAVNTQAPANGAVTAVIAYTDATTVTRTNVGSTINPVTAGKTVSGITLSTQLAPGAFFNATVQGFVPDDAQVGDTGTNCITSTIDNGQGSTPATPTNSCVTTEVTETSIHTSFYKAALPNTPVIPGGIHTWVLTIYNTGFNSTAAGPYIIDLLPTNVTYVPGSFARNTAGPVTGCPATSDFGVTQVPNYLNGRTAIIATTQVSPAALPDGTVLSGGTGAVMGNSQTQYCEYTLESTVNPGTPPGTYGGVADGGAGDVSYPLNDDYLGNDAYLYAWNGNFNPIDNVKAIADEADIDKDGNTEEGVEYAAADFQVASSAALRVTKAVKGDLDSDWIGSAEQDPSLYGTSTVGEDVSWQVSLGNNGNQPETNLVAYDLLPDNSVASGAFGTNRGVTSIRYNDAASGPGYQNQWIPTMTGPITSVAGDPVVIEYSTNPNPCRPEMTDPGNTVAAVYCGGNYQANTDWMAAGSVTDWSLVRAIRFDYGSAVFQPAVGNTCGSLAAGCFTYEWTMDVPTVDSEGNPIVDGIYTWNKIAAQGDTAGPTPTPLLATEAPWVKDIIFVDDTLYAIGDYFWFDHNADGLQDASDTAVVGATVTLTLTDGSTRTTQTDSTGFYHFDELPEGDYVVSFTAPVGWAFTSQGVGSDEMIDSNPNNVGVAPSVHLGPGNPNLTDSVASDGVSAPKIDRTVDAGLVAIPDISIVKMDVDGNDADAPGSGPVLPEGSTDLVFTINNTGTAPLVDVVVSDEVTAGDGTVSGLSCVFPDSSVGVEWAGPFAVGDEFLCTATLTGVLPGAEHTDVATVTGAGQFTGTAVEDDNPYHATATAYAIGDFVWYDSNFNGLQDADEPVASGVVVTLTDESGAEAITTTDASGIYHFDRLPAGNYTITFTAPSGYVFTVQSAGDDETVDSNPGVDGVAPTVFLGPGNPNMTDSVASDGVSAPKIDRTMDAGLVGVPDISIVKTDAAGNDADMPGSGPVLPDGSTALVFTITNTGTEPLVDVVVTDVNVVGGTVRDMFCVFPGEPDTFPNVPGGSLTWEGPFEVGASFTCHAVLDGVQPGTEHEDNATVTGIGQYSGISVDDENPYHATATAYALGDFVWYDKNKDGIQDNDEVPAPGVTVTLKDGEGTTVGTTVTDENGWYHFDQLAAGDYTVVFTAPSGYVFTAQGAGDDVTVDSNADSSGHSEVVHLGPGAPNLTDSVPADGVTAPKINRTIDAGLILDDIVTVPPSETPTPSTSVTVSSSTSVITSSTPVVSSTPSTSSSTTNPPVQPPTKKLPNTGLDVAGMIWPAMGLILVGGIMLMLLGRNRSRQH